MTKVNNEITPVTFASGVTPFATFRGSSILGLYVPAGFTATAITFNTRNPRTLVSAVVRDHSIPLSVAADASAAHYIDLTSVFPGGVEEIQLVAASAPNGTVVDIVAKQL